MIIKEGIVSFKKTFLLLNIGITSISSIASAEENFSQASHSQNSFIAGPEEGHFALESNSATMNNDADISYMGASPRAVNNYKPRGVKITPFANANVTYSDNMNLTHDNEEAGLFYGVGGGVRADMVTNRLDAAGTAAARIGWGNDQDAQIAPYLEAAATAELIRNRLYIDGIANFSSILNTASAFNSNSGASSGDIEGIGAVSISPYWRQKIGNWAVGELRYGYDQSFTTADNVGDLRSHSYQATIGTGDRFNRMSLEGSVGHIVSDYNMGLGNDGDMTQTTYMLSGTYGLTKTLSLIGNAGYDQVSDTNINDDEFSGAFYNAGLQYTPNSRASFRGMIGRRNNALSYSVDANYKVNDRLYLGATAQTQLLPPAGFANRTLLAGNNAGTLNDRIQSGMTPAEAIRTVYGLQDGGVVGGSANNITSDTVIAGNDQNMSPFRNELMMLFAGVSGRQWSGNASVGVQNSDYDNAQDQKTIIATASLGRQLGHKWSTTLGGYYYGIDTGYVQNESETLGLNLGVNYSINKYLNAFGSVQRLVRSAPIEENEFTEHSATLGINASF